MRDFFKRCLKLEIAQKEHFEKTFDCNLEKIPPRGGHSGDYNVLDGPYAAAL